MTTTRWTGDEDSARLALKLQTWVPPVTLVVAWVATSTGGMSAFFSRVFLGMWIHEFGHAITAWFCGFFAFPGPWRTIVGDERSWLVRFIVAALLGAFIAAAARARHTPFLVVGSALALLFVIGSFGISERTATMAFSFGGDAGNLVIGPLLMLTFQLPREHTLKKRWLHWGFVVIGAFAFADVASQWWRAAGDVAEIPFGRIDGVGFSDSSKLVETFGWTEQQLVRRYNTLAFLGLLTFVVGHVLGVLRGRRELADLIEDGEAVGAASTTMSTSLSSMSSSMSSPSPSSSSMSSSPPVPAGEPSPFAPPPPRRRHDPIDL